MDFLDGEVRSQDIENGLKREDFFRFNVELHEPTRLDDVKNLMTLLDTVHNGPTSQKKLVDAVIALLVSNFYFELDFPPVLEHGVYHYQGSIRCRADCHAVINALK